MSAALSDPFAPEALTFGSVVGRICTEAIGGKWSLDTLSDYVTLVRSGIPERDFREATTGAIVWNTFTKTVKDYREEIDSRLDKRSIPYEWKVRSVLIASRFIDGEYTDEDLRDFAVLSQFYPATAAAVREVLRNEPRRRT